MNDPRSMDDDEESDEEEGERSELRACLALLKECLEIVARWQRETEEERLLGREEKMLHESQYPGDEWGLWFYDEDFKFDWI